MNEKQFKEITEWQQKTFGKATPLSKISHLAEELQELVDDLVSDNPNRRLEFADCFFLLFGAASVDGMTYDDICKAIDEKFEINKKRNWGNPDENGVVKHIQESEEQK
jgi:NTP pyrophosphatase (non-canonical NTP hydrolase)